MKKIMPPAHFFAGILMMLALHLLAPRPQIVSGFLRGAGAVFIVMGLFLMMVADRQFKRRGTTIRPFQQSAVLVTDGAYRISRHPIYLGMALVLAGIAILLGSLVSWVPVVLLVIVLEIVFIRNEEAMLRATFGEEYRHYSERVRKWI